MDLENLLNNILEASAHHPKSNPHVVNYGTAGFRDRADILDSILFRVGIVASLRSIVKKGQAIGIMITASHNPEEDNGVKIIDPLGQMLESSWETFATVVSNSKNEDLVDVIKHFVLNHEKQYDFTIQPVVLMARDTRESSKRLADAASDGINCLNGVIKDYGLLTTPQLHFIVKNWNLGLDATEWGYYRQLTAAFMKLNDPSKPCVKYSNRVTIDAANGVGADKIRLLSDGIKSILDIQIVNSGSGKLNENCGADYVKLYKCVPDGFDVSPDLKYASFDGDADRLVYFYVSKDDKKFHLVDGDKIAILFVSFIQQLLIASSLDAKLSLRLIQTAYANGSSTLYAKDTLNVGVDCVRTGVKHLHSKAANYDISVYFEANGHGTILFSDDATHAIQVASAGNNEAASKLSAVASLINQTTGDAMSDLLLVETILRHNDWSIEGWDMMYTDFPSKQVKVEVCDRNRVKTSPEDESEQTCISPPGLQEAINAYVALVKSNARVFVRPSGTENIIRVYAESSSEDTTDTLSKAISAAVLELVNHEDDDQK